MSKKALVGSMTPVFAAEGSQKVYATLLVLDQNDAPVLVDGVPITQALVDLVHGDNALSIQNKMSTQIKSLYGDTSIQVIFLNGATLGIL